MRTMVIGLGPEYNYPGKLELWGGINNTRYASNHGASLICRAIMKEFEGEYYDDLDDTDTANSNFDRCIIAFATHITSWRNVNIYTDFIEKLKMPVYAFSLGIQDYAGDVAQVSNIHPSIKRLLSVVLDRSAYIGVRGAYTASILHREGIKNVLPIGCPTMYFNQSPEIKINKENQLKDIAIVYHRTMCESLWHLMEGHQLIGQDFLDQVVFTDSLKDDKKLIESELPHYNKLRNREDVINGIREKGYFSTSFQEWFDLIGSKKFIIGARLHGCIAALLQGIPAVMIARDIRVKEIAQFYNLPYFMYEDAATKNISEIFKESDFSKFEETYKLRYNNYLSFLDLNKLSHNMQSPENFRPEYKFTLEDTLTEKEIIYRSIQLNQEWQTQNQVKLENNIRSMNMVMKVLKKVPFYDRIKNKFVK